MIKLTTSEMKRKQKVERFGGQLLLALACFFIFICTPVYILASSNIMISRTVFPILWDFVQDLTHYLYYWVAFSFLVYISARYTIKSTGFLLLVYAGCSFAKYFFSLLLDNLINSDWSSMNYHMYYVMIDFAGDLLLIGMAFLICYLFLHRKKENITENNCFDFSGMFRLSNPVLKCSFSFSMVLMVSRVVSRLIYDFNYGAPQGRADLIVMILSYFGDIASGVIGYLLMYLIVSQIHLKSEEASQLKK